MLGPGLAFSPSALARTRISFKLCGSGVVAEAKRSYEIFRLCSFGSGDDSHFEASVGVELQFRTTKGDASFENISMAIFGGQLISSPSPLLRLEWEAAPSDGPSPHAQPHWHVYPDLFGANVSAAASESLPFHFAMMARWHRLSDESLHYRHPDAVSIGNWIKSSLRYTCAQLGYGFGE